jgi:class 3 adenylate cyclase/TolB-like protein/Flp pilus assembly protein TadD
MPEKRLLSAIMFSDIEGYTRVMEEDEKTGRSMARRYREVLQEGLNLYEGTLIKTYGDGSLCIFTSAVQAVRCAYYIQLELQKTLMVPLRIGLHMGDIVIDNDELYGAGVNAASRIESMGVAGSILVSGTISKEIKNQHEFQMVSLGFFEFKNIEYPMEVFALRNEGLVVPEAGTLKGKFKKKARKLNPVFYIIGIFLILAIGWWAGRQPSAVEGGVIQGMAVLPFQSSSGTEDQEIMRDGIHDGLISELGQLGSVRVVDKKSTLLFTQSNKTLQEISQDLEVDGIVTGDLSVSEDSVLLNLRLVKTLPEEKVLWSSIYERKIDEILRLYQDVRTDIARRIKVGLTTYDIDNQPMESDVDAETYKAYLRGMYFLNKSTPDEFDKGMQYLQDAVELDPANPRAYAGLALGYMILGHGPDPENQVWKRGRAAALQAIKLDSTLAEAHAVLGMIKTYYEWDYEGAEKAYLKALEINPNLAIARFQYAWYLACFERYEEAIKHHLLAKELDPLLPLYTYDMGSLYLYAGEVDKALKEVQEGLELDPDFGHGIWVLGNIYVAKGMFEEAIQAHQRAASIHPIWRGALGGTYALAGQPDKTREILEEFINQEISPRSALWIAYMNLTLEEYDEMYKWLDYELPDPWIVAIRSWPEFRVVHDDTRFQALLKRLNLPPI